MIRNPKQILGKQAINVTFAVIDDATTSASSVWSSQKTASELAGKAEIDDTATDTETTWSSSRIASLLPTESASGAVASFETPLTLPLVSHKVTIEPVQAGTGDPSPSNPRAISGWSAVNVTKTGKNLLNPSASVYYNYTINEDGSLNTENANKRLCTDFIKCDASKTLVASSDVKPSTSTNVYDFVEVAFYDKDKNYISRVTQTYKNTPLVAVPPSNAAFMKYAEYGNLFTAATPAYFSDYQRQLAYEESATTYEPYTSITVTIQLGQTVYGGELDVTNGVLRVTWIRQDIGGWTWTQNQTDPNTFNSPFIAIGSPIQPANTSDAICEVCPLYTSSTVTQYDYGFAIAIGLNYFYFKNKDYSSPADFKTAMSGKYFAYKLATPVEITLTPEQINTLKGVNNIWADTGDTAVEYKQDIQTYIDSRLSSGTRSLSLAKAPVETKEETKQEEQEGGENVDR